MKIGDFLREQTGRLVLHAAAMLALSLFLLSIGTAPGALVIILLFWAPGLALLTVAKYLSKKRRIDGLWSVLEQLPEKYLFMECVPKPAGVWERQMFQMLRRVGKSMIEEVSAARLEMREYREYVENWVHEIKLPMTAISLVCENNPSDVTRKIGLALSQVEQQVERCLYYARSGSPEQDLVVRKVQLADVADAALSRHKTLLIQSGVRVETRGLEAAVYTDPKWLEFILGQLLANAVRYRGENPVLILSAERREGDTPRVRLTVEDNGIGIPESELPRIFQKGFTGSNGRARGGATGMGLYLCSKLAAHLQIDLTAESLEHQYTRIHLLLPAAPDAEK